MPLYNTKENRASLRRARNLFIVSVLFNSAVSVFAFGTPFFITGVYITLAGIALAAHTQYVLSHLK